MRALLLLAGILLGAALMALWWPRTPSGTVLPAASDVRVSLSDGYLSRVIRRRASGNPFVAVRAVQVRSAPPLLVVRADASLGPLTAPVSMEIQPVARGGDVQVHIVATHVGIVPIPGPLSGIVAAGINGSLQHILGAGATVREVSVTPRGLDIAADYP